MRKWISSVFSLYFSLFIFWAGPALADEVVLDNGDKLTGTVVKVEGGK